MKINNKVFYYGQGVITSEIFIEGIKFKQHSFTTTFYHSLNVANIALKLGKIFKYKNERDLVVSGLMHDFQLNRCKQIDKYHLLNHPKFAISEANRYFPNYLNTDCQNAILSHLWPVSAKKPKGKLAWILTFSDKIASVLEFLRIIK